MASIRRTQVGRLLTVLAIVMLWDAIAPELARGQTFQPSATSVNFGSVPVDSGPVSQFVIVTNIGNAAGVVASANFTGSHAATFTYVGLELPATLLPGESVALQIFFDPAGVGVHQATLTLSTNDPVTPL
jgi:hypothetical protein